MAGSIIYPFKLTSKSPVGLPRPRAVSPLAVALYATHYVPTNRGRPMFGNMDSSFFTFPLYPELYYMI
jgi:hypothetical protein